MNKKLVAVAIAGAFAGASPAVMAGAMAPVKLGGFIDSIFTFQNEALDDTSTNVDGDLSNPANQKFTTDGEVDFMGGSGNVNARIDLDVADSTTEVEQAVISWMTSDALTVNIGKMNHNVTWEGQDAPDLYQTSFGQIASIVRGQTSTAGSAQGVVLAFNAGAAAVNVGLLNDLHGADEENSFLLQASGSPMDGLDLKASLVTQADNTAANATSAENVIDVNGQYGMDNWFVALEILSLGTDADSFADNAWGLTGNMDFGNGFGATLRYDTVSYNDTGAVSNDDTTSTTLAGTYAAADNLGLVLELRNDDDGTDSFSTVTLEAVGTFGN